MVLGSVTVGECGFLALKNILFQLLGHAGPIDNLACTGFHANNALVGCMKIFDDRSTQKRRNDNANALVDDPVVNSQMFTSVPTGSQR